MNDTTSAEYIKAALAQGRSKEEIYKELLGQGRTIEGIQADFAALTEEESKEDSQKRVITVIVTIAAVLVGAGIFSFVASNWQEMSRPTKVSIIVVSMLVSYAIGWHLRERTELSKTGTAFMLLGSIIYGAGIFLIAQMFNIRANWPDGFILWMLGVLAMAFAIESYPLFYLAIPLGIFAIFGYPSDFLFAGNSFLLTSSWLLLVATVAMGITGRVMRMRIAPELNDRY